ncbi:MAG: hypothetical protein ACP5GD_02665 [Candidatus Micrarchaeia archaeon]
MLQGLVKEKFEFSLLLFLFFSFEITAYILPLFSLLSYIIFVLFAVLTSAYFYYFSLEPPKHKNTHLLFIIAIALLGFAIFVSHAAVQFIKATVIWGIVSLVFFVELFATFFMLSLAAYFAKKNKSAFAVLLFSAFVVIMLLFGTMLVLKGMGEDDEMFIVVKATQLLLRGVNPYAVSFSSQLLSNSSRFLPTVSLQNTILGNLQYPPLFLLAYAPFYIISHGNAEASFLVSYGFYLFFFLATLFLVRKSSRSLAPLSLPFAFVVAVSIVLVSAVMDMLLVAVLLLAYSKLESKYAWLFIGVAISLQELLWVPVMFMLVYLANEKGVKHAAKQFAGAIGVFLAISAWFIASKPGAFFASMFMPLYQPLPSNTSPIGFALIKLLGVDVSVYPLLFGLYLLVFSLLLLYHNRKPMVFLFSMLVFLLFDRSIVTYYTMFGVLFAFALFEAEEKRKKGILTKAIRKNKRDFFIIVALIVSLALFLIIRAHTAYLKGFNIELTNQSLRSINGTSLITGTLRYSVTGNKTVYAFIGVINATHAYEFGLVNQTILLPKGKLKQELCNTDTCYANTNKILLNGTGTYNFVAVANISKAKCAYAAFYSSNYYYVSNPVCG